MKTNYEKYSHVDFWNYPEEFNEPGIPFYKVNDKWVQESPLTKIQKLLADPFRCYIDATGHILNNYIAFKFQENEPYGGTRCAFALISEHSKIDDYNYFNQEERSRLTIYDRISGISDEDCIYIMNHFGLINLHHDTSIEFNYSNPEL